MTSVPAPPDPPRPPPDATEVDASAPIANQLRALANQLRYQAREYYNTRHDGARNEAHRMYALGLHEAAHVAEQRAAAADGTAHVDFVCDADHDDGRSCQWCDGGLWACKVCGSFEGMTTTDCPREQMSEESGAEVYAGRRDYYAGTWITGRCSQASPAWFSHEFPDDYPRS